RSGGGRPGSCWLGGGPRPPLLGGGGVVVVDVELASGAGPSRISAPASSYSTGTRLGCSARSASAAHANDCWMLSAARPSFMARWTMYSTMYEWPYAEFSYARLFGPAAPVRMRPGASASVN